MAVSLQAALDLLRTERIKDRQEGVALVEQIFRDPLNVAQLDPKEDGKAWLKTFQSLFACVLLDKAACLKKGGLRGAQHAALSRLRDSAYAVRQLVERSVQHLNRRAIKSILSHLVQMLNYQGAIFQPVSMSYLKALSAILQFRAHVDQLDVDEWVMAAELCFNALLDDDLSRPLDQEEAEEASGEDNPNGSGREGARALGLEDVELMVCLHHLLGSPTAPILTEERFGLRMLGRYATFLKRYHIECSSHLPALTGLNELLRELELNETAEVILFTVGTWRSLFSLWLTKNKQLKEQLVICCRMLVPVMLSCLSPSFDSWTRQQPTVSAIQAEARLMLAELHRLILGEQNSRWGCRTISLSSLRLSTTGRDGSRQPFALSTVSQGAAFSEPDGVTWAILELNAAILAGLLPLPQDGVPLRRVVVTQQTTSREPSVLEEAEETLLMTATASPTKRALTAADQPLAKRRRTGTDSSVRRSGAALIEGLLADLKQALSLRAAAKSAASQADRLWRLQMVLFIVGRWLDLDTGLRDALVDALLVLAGEPNAEVQSWSFVCLAEVAGQCVQIEDAGDRLTPYIVAAFSQAWTLACRRLPSTAVARSAAHLATTLLGGTIIPKEAMTSDLRSILVEIDIQGPALLCDSSASFLAAALQHASNDAQLFSLDLRPKALSWVSSIWQPGRAFATGQAPPRSCDLEWTDLFSLLCCIVDLASKLNPSLLNVNTRHTAVFASMSEEKQLASLRSYMLFQRVQPSASTRSWCIAAVSGSSGTLPESAPRSAPLGAEERRLFSLLERSVLHANTIWTSATDAASSSEKAFARTCSPDQAAAMLELALLALAFTAMLVTKGVAPSPSLGLAAAKLLNCTVGLATSSREWTQAERLVVLRSLAPLLPPDSLDTGFGTGTWEGLIVQAGPRSGVRDLHAIQCDRPRSPPRCHVGDDVFLGGFWQTLAASQGLQGLTDALYSMICQELKGGPPDVPPPGSIATSQDAGDDDDDDDDFIGRARVASHDDTRAQRESGAIQVYSRELTALCVTVLAQAPKLAAGSTEPNQNERLVDLMFEGSLESLVQLGPSLVRSVSNGSLWLTQRDLSDLLDHIGSDLLTSYRFARDQEARCLAIDLVSATMPTWLNGKRINADLLDKLRKLCIFFTEQVTKQKWRSPWKVRRRVSEFLDLLIRSDPQELLWTREEELISRCPPSEAVLYLNSDRDVRIRAAGSAVSACLFDHLQRDDDGFASLYEQLKDRLPLDHAKPENVATRVLCLTNVTIVSSSVRRIALFHLLEIFLVTGSRELTLQAAFEVISERLGFSSPRELYKCFAGQITWGMITNSYDPLKMPHKILGFRSRKECIEQTFKESGSMMLAASTESGRNYFGTLARLARRTVKEGIQECLPFLAASQVGFAAEEVDATTSIARKAVWVQALEAIHQWSTDEESSQTLQSICNIADQLVTVLLTMFYEPASSTSFPDNIRSKDAKVHQTFSALSQASLAAQPSLCAHEPNRPFFSGSAIYESILVLKESGVNTTGTEIVYHVLRQMFFRIGQSPFINDQHRFLEATKLYIAMCSETIESSPLLLDVLLQGVGFLVGQPHTHTQACSLANWAMSACTRLDCLPERLASTLTAFATQSKQAEPDLPCSPGAEGSRPPQSDLREWTENAVARLLRSAKSRAAGELALTLWPDVIPPRLKDSAPSTARPEEVAGALQRCPDAIVTASVLDRMRLSLKAASDEERRIFTRTTIWLLFERLKLHDLRQQSVDELALTGQALSEILSICDGRLQTPGLDALQDSTSSYVRSVLDSVSRLAEPSRAMQAVVVLVILQHLHGRSLSQSEKAYTTLRGILSMAKTMTSALDRWPGRAYEELSILAEFETLEPCGSSRSHKDLEDPELAAMASEFDSWIRKITGVISHLLIKTTSDAFYHHVQSLVEQDANVAARLFPILLQLFTADDGFAGEEETIRFLDAGREAISLHFQEVLSCNDSDTRSWAAIIEGFLHVRRWRVLDNDPTYSDLWYAVDFLLLARRSLDCKMYTAALLFVELFFEHSTDAKDAEEKEGIVSSLLYDAYSNVEDPDGFYGIDNANVLESLTRRLHHEGEWHRALQLHAADYETTGLGSSANENGKMVGVAFHMLGFNRLATKIGERSGTFRGGSGGSGGGASVTGGAFDYDVAWRTGVWDLPATATYVPGNSCGIFATLRALHRDRSDASVDREVANCFARELEGVAGAKPEAINDVKKVQLDLLSLHEVKAWRQLASQLGAEEAVVHVSAFWAEPRPAFSIECYERILSVRQSMMQALRAKEQLNEIGDFLSPIAEESMKLERAMMIRLSAAARKQGCLQMSMNATAKAQKLHSSLSDKSNHTEEEFASVLWAQDEHAFALGSLRAIIDDFQVGETSAARSRYRKAVLMARLGEWRATARSQQPRMIDTTLFKPALELMVAQNNQAQGTEEQAKVAYKWARFADEQYRNVDMEEIERLRVHIDRRKEEIRQNQVESDKTSSKSMKQRLMQFQKQAEKILRQDQNHLKELESTRTLFLQRAIAMYSRSLIMSDRYDDAAGRLTSLWFDNSFDESANTPLSASLTQVPSHKFIPLMHQLSARLSSSKASNKGAVMFQSNLANLVLRMCRDHPFHTLYALFTLLKAGKDAKAVERTARSGNAADADGLASSQRQRSLAAEGIWARVRGTDRLKRRIQAFEEVCQAYVEWAEVNLGHQFPSYFTSNGVIRKGPLKMPSPSELKLARLHDVDVPVATAKVPIDKTCEYRDIVSIVRYSETFTTAGGIHLPKINECIGSDGKRYRQLFKRDDDLRQDAVMQQVFGLVNGLLDKDRRASQRQLTVRMYAVIPLGPQCGMLEFVTNTVPIGEVLIRMHSRYGPNDMSPMEARTRIREAQGLTAKQKLEVFLDVCERMPPAFRFFFFERQKDPPSWFAMRLNYTRSAATTSIVGHILGLGDRHVSNILLDKQSGELVHIDFGVAFDQGKLLPIPELVPFRLTRDLVDGMGLSGIEGTYRRCCEETLRVLRDGRDIVKTVLEVFKHDPLFAWTSNPIKVLKAQGAAGEEDTAPESVSHNSRRIGEVGRAAAPSVEPANATSIMTIDTAELSAERAITSVMTKLSSSLSVEYTVNELIQQAMDAGNLSAIFQGWQAAL
ncbi:Serine/threonine-protein kinase tel1 [Thecaphora frezii]